MHKYLMVVSSLGRTHASKWEYVERKYDVLIKRVLGSLPVERAKLVIIVPIATTLANQLQLAPLAVAL